MFLPLFGAILLLMKDEVTRERERVRNGEGEGEVRGGREKGRER